MPYIETLKDIFITNNRYMYIVDGLIFSISVTTLAAIIGIILGMFLALMKISKIKTLNIFATSFIDIIRGTPAVIQLMILANIVFVGNLRNTPILIIGALAFGINSSAYVAEIIRSGIESIDNGQMQAARALGLSYSQAMIDIVIPQAIKQILPTLVSEFIALLKETSIIGFIGGIDLLRSASIITSQTYRGVEPLITVGIIYFILTSIFTHFMRKIERKLKNYDQN